MCIRDRAAPARPVGIDIAEGGAAFGDPQLLRVMMQNLLENAWKYSGREAAPRIAFGREAIDGAVSYTHLTLPTSGLV